MLFPTRSAPADRPLTGSNLLKPKLFPFAQAGAPASVLVLKPSSLGDVIHTLPAVAALKRHWPATHVQWLVNPEWSPFLTHNPVVDAVSLFPRSEFRGPLGPLRLLSWARSFARTVRADWVLDFQCLLRSALLGRLCAPKAFYGLSDAREGASLFYDAAAPVAHVTHAVDRYLSLVESLGVPVPEQLEWPFPETSLPGDFDASTPFIAVHPFARGAGKSLSLRDLRLLCEALSPARIVLVGRSDTPPSPLPNVDNWLNRTTLLELTAILQRASWTVSVDSGPMHIAAALSSRVLALHTWSDPQKVGPYPPTACVWKDGFLFQRGRPDQQQPAKTMPEIADWILRQIQCLGSGSALRF